MCTPTMSQARIVTFFPHRTAVNSNKNLCIYHISICFYNCQNRFQNIACPAPLNPLFPFGALIHNVMQCFETSPGPTVEPINPVTQKKFSLGFMKNSLFRNLQKLTKTQNPIPVEPLVEPINNFYSFFSFQIMLYILNFQLKSQVLTKKKLGFPFSILYL